MDIKSRGVVIEFTNTELGLLTASLIHIVNVKYNNTLQKGPDLERCIRMMIEFKTLCDRLEIDYDR